MDFLIEHTGFWIDLKSILAFILLVVIIIVFAVRVHFAHKKEKELKEELGKETIIYF